MLAMPLEHRIASGSPLQDVLRIHIYDSQQVSVGLESYSDEVGCGSGGRFVEIGVGFLGMGTFQGSEWADSAHSPEECEADNESGERYCLAVAGLGGKLAAGTQHLHTS